MHTVNNLEGERMEIVKNGHKFVTGNDSWFSWFWESVDSGQWEPETFEIMDKYLTYDATYLDVGAWIGPTVLYASRLCHRCFAFEPSPVSYKELCENLALNNVNNVIALNEAVFNYDGVLTLGNEGDIGGSSTRVGQFDHAFQIPCRTLKSFISTEKIDTHLFIKMDVEGAEESILEDIEFFEKHKPTLYVSLHPQWFRDLNTGMATIERVKQLYRQQYEVANNAWLFVK